MNARQIEVFRTIMRCGTLTGAAQMLNVSQPALSQLLLHAEDQLGYKLFQRLGGRLVPTPEAVQLFPEAERLHHDLDSFRRFASDLRLGKAGSVRLASSAPPALSFLPSALQTFRSTCPGMRLVSFVIPVAVMAEKLDRGEADLGVALNDSPRALIEAEPIGQTEVICLLPVDHPLARKEFVTIGDLAGETLISYRSDSLPGARLEQAFAREGARMRPQVEIDVSIIALSFVQQGIGIALVDGLIPWSGFPGVVLRPFRPVVALPISILVSTRRPLSRNQELLRGEIRRALALYAASPKSMGMLRPYP